MHIYKCIDVIKYFINNGNIFNIFTLNNIFHFVIPFSFTFTLFFLFLFNDQLIIYFKQKSILLTGRFIYISSGCASVIRSYAGVIKTVKTLLKPCIIIVIKK